MAAASPTPIPTTSAPYLYAILNDWSGTLVLVVGIGVGLAAAIGTLRFIFGWSLKPLIYLTLAPVLIGSGYMAFDPELSKTVGLAFDCGAVTTGPVTVPLVLALGIGIARAVGKGSDSLSGFGIVTLASLFPIIAVMSLAFFVAAQTGPEEIILAAHSAGLVTETTPWYETSPGVEIIGGIRAIVPLVLFLLIVMVALLRERIPSPKTIGFGIFLCIMGMIVFNLGLSYGLSKLGGQSGSLVPAAFTQLESVEGSPLYFLSLGLLIALAFAWLLGFGATLAEPALNALGFTVENLTHGSFKKSTLMYAVSLGVATGIAFGVAKIIFSIPIAYLLIPGYLIAIVLTALSKEEFVNIAWDSAGVTTGPVTVPLVLAMGLGFGNALDAVEGFGILSMASIGPIIFVLSAGIYGQRKIAKRHTEHEQPREHVSMITCIVQRGKADVVVQAAHDAGAQAATIYYGYGTGIREQLGLLGLAVDVEKEIIITLVGDDQVDRIFERMYFAAELDLPAAGIIYITKLEKAATYIPKEVIDRIAEGSSS